MKHLFDNRIAERHSGIELLNILAMILIVISHVVQTLRSENLYVSSSDYVIALSVASYNVSRIFLVFFRILVF